LVIRNVTIMTAAGPTIRNGAIAVENGKIVAVGQTVTAGPIPRLAVLDFPWRDRA
jgi:imidazolonepropionase-like amidohydrolase